MRLNLQYVAFETTRRCNEQCEFCMRGPSQNIDLTEDLVDAFFYNNSIACISHICFTGGEPTLNPNIIIYIINKIIREGLDVRDLVMLTNGQIFHRDLIEAFNRFNEYNNERYRKSLLRILGDSPETNELLKEFTDNHVRITFSSDQFHKTIPNEIIALYYRYAKGLKITFQKFKKEENIHKTGFSQIGKEFIYKLNDLNYYYDEKVDLYSIMNWIYLTANGFVTSEGIGEYSDMDAINMGHIHEITIEDLLGKFGVLASDTEPTGLEKKLQR